MNELKPCRNLSGGHYVEVGSLCGLPLEWDKASDTPVGATQYTEIENYSKQVPEVPNDYFVVAVEQWEPDGQWRIVLHSMYDEGIEAFEYAGPFETLEAAVVAYMLLWP